MNQVAVRGVNLNDIDASLDSPPRRQTKRLHRLPDLAHGQLPRRPEAALGRKALQIPAPVLAAHRADNIVRPPTDLRGGARAGPLRARADPRRRGARLAARVRKLDAGEGALAAHEGGDAAHGGGLRGGPQARAVRRDAAVGRDAGRFDEDECRALQRVVAQRRHVVVGQRADVWACRRRRVCGG